jgi:hypothetical protein
MLLPTPFSDDIGDGVSGSASCQILEKSAGNACSLIRLRRSSATAAMSSGTAPSWREQADRRRLSP